MKRKLSVVIFLVAVLQFAVFAQDNIEGAFYFSNSPFASSSAGGSSTKTSFSSAEFLYGRFEPKDGKKISDVFSFAEDDKKNNGISYLQYSVSIYQGKTMVSPPSYGSWSYCLVNKEDRDKNYFNFDVLPAPGKVITVIGAEKNFSSGKTCSPLYAQIKTAAPAKDGEYTIVISFFKTAYDVYGKELKQDSRVSTILKFDFAIKDVPELLRNYSLAGKEASVNAFAFKELPAIFKHSKALQDANLSSAKIMGYLAKNYPGWSILKLATSREGYTGPLWVTDKNNDGIFRIRWADADIYIAYKDKEDDKCYIRMMEVRQDYIGGGRYSALFIRSAGDKRLIPCAAVK